MDIGRVPCNFRKILHIGVTMVHALELLGKLGWNCAIQVDHVNFWDPLLDSI